MRKVLLYPLFVSSLLAQVPTGNLWAELTQKREALGAFHQEFKASRQLRVKESQSSEWQVSIDAKPGKWVERTVSGWGSSDRYFTGPELLTVDAGVGEYLREKVRSNKPPHPGPYDVSEVVWAKALETGRGPCGLAPLEHTCVQISAPLVPYTRLTTTSKRESRLEGSAKLIVDTENGLILRLETGEVLESEAAKVRYVREIAYDTVRLRYGQPVADNVFFPPIEDLHQVKSFTVWDAKRMRKMLAGKPAPALSVKDMNGAPADLGMFRGKTVLLDFWASWCPPCKADAPALEKLQEKYGASDLVILGIDVGEERAAVNEYFGKKTPHYRTIFSIENELPRQYQVPAIPTYIIIDENGNFVSAAQGDQGFYELKDQLKKAGMEVDLGKK